ncbi:MAG TPA: aminotransferase class III-fold pyridoxal phosphate-dependent enzyme, partial [Acidobacteriota bacterium]|nr:aminotransferase class III-fold pyridoxal phosphate-dependent enzyme [Acidobacteriota bacterium]
GLMIGVEMGDKAGDVVRRLLQKGVIANVAHDTVLRLLPPLIIDINNSDEFLAVFDDVLKEIETATA